MKFCFFFWFRVKFSFSPWQIFNDGKLSSGIWLTLRTHRPELCVLREGWFIHSIHSINSNYKQIKPNYKQKTNRKIQLLQNATNVISMHPHSKDSWFPCNCCSNSESFTLALECPSGSFVLTSHRHQQFCLHSVPCHQKAF